ncbi:tetraspanin-8-like [Alosa sapidissima]|uniref:tetraspanin-8-like n=1 Tax=Alosa sapidissima TaxID=34773 RepID=UPI001C081855|nr:tetraspanin-8-like [Alosa sapidissima]
MVHTKRRNGPSSSFRFFLGIGTVSCLIGAVESISERQTLSRKFEEVFERDARLQYVQEYLKLECCGTRNGYQDWNLQIPESCICPASYRGTPKCKETSSLRSYEYMQLYKTKTTEIYSETCHSLIMRYINMMMDAATGIFFGFSIVGLIGVIMAIIITCKIKKQVTYECSKPPAYEELYTMKCMPVHV